MINDEFDEKSISKKDLLYIDSFSPNNIFDYKLFNILENSINFCSNFDDNILYNKVNLFMNLEKKPTKVLFKIKKRGRKIQKAHADCKKKDEYYHDKFTPDNLLKRVHTHYMTFIIDYANEVIHKFGYKDIFIQANYKYKKFVNKSNFSFLKGQNIGYILSLEISPKFRNENNFKNKILYEKVIKIPIIKKLFDQNYISLFENIYYKNKKYINLEYDDKNDIIIFSEKVKTFDALLKKIRNNDKMDEETTEEYIEKLKVCIKENYLSDDIEINL